MFRSALHFAASWGHTGMLNLLTAIENINLDLRDYRGKTPLMKVMSKANSFLCFC